jgi:hypothetical protein
MGRLRVLSKNGDDETLWNRDNAESTAVAERTFRDLIARGYAAFAKTGNGHELVKSFDPIAEEIILVRPLVGG